MKITLTQYNDHVDITIRDDTGINLHCYTFDNLKLAQAFMTGFTCCKSVANSAVQSIPTVYKIEQVNQTL